MLRGGRTDRTQDVTHCKRRYIHTGRKPTSAWGLRKGAVGTAEECFGIGEDDGGGDCGGVVAAEGGGGAAGGAILGPVTRTPGFGEAVQVRNGGARLEGERPCRLDEEEDEGVLLDDGVGVVAGDGGDTAVSCDAVEGGVAGRAACD